MPCKCIDFRKNLLERTTVVETHLHAPGCVKSNAERIEDWETLPEAGMCKLNASNSQREQEFSCNNVGMNSWESF